MLLSPAECKHIQSQNCAFFDWHHTIKLILYLACLLNINCSSPQLIKEGPTVYHMCPTLIMFTNHTHSQNSAVTLRTCVWGSALSAPPVLHTATLDTKCDRRHFFFLINKKRHFSPSFPFPLLQPLVVNRHAVLGSQLFHSYLCHLYHETFFLLCKEHGIRFDPEVKTLRSLHLHLHVVIISAEIFIQSNSHRIKKHTSCIIIET